MSVEAPKLSIGLAVRNEKDVIERCIDSILSQDFTDFELVICDNVSDDGTIEILERYARADPRIKLNLNPVNIGSHENMGLVLARSRGEFFRWISADDWLEPRYISTCLRALENHPSAIGVTTWFTIHTTDGTTRYEEFRGEFLDSEDPVRRFDRMLWFFHAGDAKYDPVYGLYRREYLLRCNPFRPSERTDWLLSTELALRGPILNIAERLAHRTRNYARIDRAAFRRRLDPVRAEQIRTSPWRLARQMFALAVWADLTNAQLRRCRWPVLRFWYKQVICETRSWLSDIRYRVLGG
jgi:glycosyltransferase involved in cell wall biosynthesis